jgi:IS30 family transposase
VRNPREGTPLIVGRRNRSAIATLVDRHSRYLLLVRLPDGHDAAAVRDALTAALTQLPANA